MGRLDRLHVSETPGGAQIFERRIVFTGFAQRASRACYRVRVRRTRPEPQPGAVAQRQAASTSRTPLRLFVAVVGAAQVLGGAVAVAIVVRGVPVEAASLGQAVSTSFGVVSVDQKEEIASSNPDRDTLVPGLKEVQIALTMTNLLARPVGYWRDQVSLQAAGSAATIPVASASIRQGRVAAGSAFRAVYRFDVPTAANRLLVRFDDPGRSAPVWIDLGAGPFPVGVSSAYNLRLHEYTPHPHGAGR
jgi:hypothetical protein